MNYRHAFQAGNFADVLKHLVLTLVLVHMRKKAAPFHMIDTNAGCGHYNLASIEAENTGEWCNGTGRLLAARDCACWRLTSISWRGVFALGLLACANWCAIPAARSLRGA